MNHLSLNPEYNKRIHVIDNFFKDPHAVREYALQQEFFNDEGYIGNRTRQQFFIPGTKEAFENIMGIKIKGWHADDDFFRYGMNGRFQFAISGQPLVYHCDAQKWAGMIYLTPDAPFESGTAFYAHKKTRIRHNSDPNIMDCFNQKTFVDPTPYELVDVVGNVFNRLVLFDGGLIHSASCYFGDNIQNCRLWQIFFFD
jgi:hypothetical protein